MATNLLEGFPLVAPLTAVSKLRYADVGVTATAKEFEGIYRGKQYHASDIDAVFERAAKAGVEKILLTGMSNRDVEFNAEVARRHPEQCYLTIGTHPYHAAEADAGGEEYYEELKQSINAALQAKVPLLKAFGEIGLDYDHLDKASKTIQIRVFRRQLDLFAAEGWQLPLFLHCRAAFDDFVHTIKEYQNRLPRGGLVHSFVGSTEQLSQLLDLGLDISINGFACRDKDSLSMIRDVPLERLHLETDAPWGDIQASSPVAQAYLKNLSPLPASKKKDKFQLGLLVKDRNESCTIGKIALIVAGLKEIPVDVVARHAWENSVKMFNLEGDTHPESI